MQAGTDQRLWMRETIRGSRGRNGHHKSPRPWWCLAWSDLSSLLCLQHPGGDEEDPLVHRVIRGRGPSLHACSTTVSTVTSQEATSTYRMMTSDITWPTHPLSCRRDGDAQELTEEGSARYLHHPHRAMVKGQSGSRVGHDVGGGSRTKSLMAVVPSGKQARQVCRLAHTQVTRPRSRPDHSSRSRKRLGWKAWE